MWARLRLRSTTNPSIWWNSQRAAGRRGGFESMLDPIPQHSDTNPGPHARSILSELDSTHPPRIRVRQLSSPSCGDFVSCRLVVAWDTTDIKMRDISGNQRGPQKKKGPPIFACSVTTPKFHKTQPQPFSTNPPPPNPSPAPPSPVEQRPGDNMLRAQTCKNSPTTITAFPNGPPNHPDQPSTRVQ